MNVIVELTGTLVARTGARRAHVAVPEDATVADVIDTLAAEYGPQVRAGVLDGEHLRSDTVVVRESADAAEPVSPASPVTAGDTVRFRLAS